MKKSWSKILVILIITGIFLCSYSSSWASLKRLEAMGDMQGIIGDETDYMLNIANLTTVSGQKYIGGFDLYWNNSIDEGNSGSYYSTNNYKYNNISFSQSDFIFTSPERVNYLITLKPSWNSSASSYKYGNEIDGVISSGESASVGNSYEYGVNLACPITESFKIGGGILFKNLSRDRHDDYGYNRTQKTNGNQIRLGWITRAGQVNIGIDGKIENEATDDDITYLGESTAAGSRYAGQNLTIFANSPLSDHVTLRCLIGNSKGRRMDEFQDSRNYIYNGVLGIEIKQSNDVTIGLGLKLQKAVYDSTNIVIASEIPPPSAVFLPPAPPMPTYTSKTLSMHFGLETPLIIENLFYRTGITQKFFDRETSYGSTSNSSLYSSTYYSTGIGYKYHDVTFDFIVGTPILISSGRSNYESSDYTSKGSDDTASFSGGITVVF